MPLEIKKKLRVKLRGYRLSLRHRNENGQTELILIGDVHGKFGAYKRLLAQAADEPTFQVGDMGVGFGRPLEKQAPHHRFIRGNHDNPEACQEHPNYAGEWGYDKNMKLFFIGGAYSVDGPLRRKMMEENPMERRIWWPDEELSDDQLAAAFGMYRETKPEIMVSHDCPQSIAKKLIDSMTVKPMGGFGVVSSRTSEWLEKMFSAWQPRLWFFGHYHRDWSREVNGTAFQCLNELSAVQL